MHRTLGDSSYFPHLRVKKFQKSFKSFKTFGDQELRTKNAVGESEGILVLGSYFQKVLKLLKLFWNFHMARFSGTNLSLQESAGILASQLAFFGFFSSKKMFFHSRLSTP